MEPTAGESASYLPELPDPCQLKVLQYLHADDDNRSLCSAARAHSRLHQAAVQALTSITSDISTQQQVNDILHYLDRRGQHVDCIDFTGNSLMPSPHLRQFPPSLQPSSLRLAELDIQLLQGEGFDGADDGVLGAPALASTLKQLSLKYCTLTDGDYDGCKLTAALQQLPGLEHLSIVRVKVNDHATAAFLLLSVLQLQQLTHLELAGVDLEKPDMPCSSNPLQPLQALTRLADLRLDGTLAISTNAFTCAYSVSSDVLPCGHNLTRVEFSSCHFEPGALAGQTQLQHLCLHGCHWAEGTRTASGEAQLLSHLPQLQQMTRLEITDSLKDGGLDPPAGYAALTASSKLQHLDISNSQLPAGVWQHLFPAGKQYPNLHVLNISNVEDATAFLSFDWFDDFTAPAPEGSLLVSCCPDLQVLNMRGLQYSAELLPSLLGLSGLHTLLLQPPFDPVGDLHDVCQLTGLRQLALVVADTIQGEGLLLQLTQLQGLSQLDYYGPSSDSAFTDVCLTSQGPDDVPVWCQILQHHVLHDDMVNIAQQETAPPGSQQQGVGAAEDDSPLQEPDLEAARLAAAAAAIQQDIAAALASAEEEARKGSEHIYRGLGPEQSVVAWALWPRVLELKLKILMQQAREIADMQEQHQQQQQQPL